MTESKLRQALAGACDQFEAIANSWPNDESLVNTANYGKNLCRAALEEPGEAERVRALEDALRSFMDACSWWWSDDWDVGPEVRHKFSRAHEAATVALFPTGIDPFKDQGLGPVGSGGEKVSSSGDGCIKDASAGEPQGARTSNTSPAPATEPASGQLAESVRQFSELSGTAEPKCKNPDCRDGELVIPHGPETFEYKPCPDCNEAPRLTPDTENAPQHIQEFFAPSGAEGESEELNRLGREKLVRDMERDAVSGASPSAPDDAREATYCTVRESEDCWDIECRFTDGQKFAAVEVDRDYEWLADKICAFLNGQATQGWQPIETAPRDGSPVDLLFPYPRGRQINFRWEAKAPLGGVWVQRKPAWKDGVLLSESEWEYSTFPNMEPTHWMLPPAPPNGESDE